MADKEPRLAFFKPIYGVEGEHDTIYMRRLILGRFRLHIFYRGDLDLDCHDHPFNFWTFPLTSYVEEVAKADGFGSVATTLQVVKAFRFHWRPARHTHRVIGRWNGRHKRIDPCMSMDPEFPMWDSYDAKGNPNPLPFGGYRPDVMPDRIVPVFTPEDAPWEYEERPRKIVTLVWTSKKIRSWGFLKNRDGQWCWVPWKQYVFGGGKHAPCE